jgi:hypothetical protein
MNRQAASEAGPLCCGPGQKAAAACEEALDCRDEALTRHVQPASANGAYLSEVYRNALARGVM